VYTTDGLGEELEVMDMMLKPLEILLLLLLLWLTLFVVEVGLPAERLLVEDVLLDCIELVEVPPLDGVKLLERLMVPEVLVLVEDPLAELVGVDKLLDRDEDAVEAVLPDDEDPDMLLLEELDLPEVEVIVTEMVVVVGTEEVAVMVVV